MRASSLSNKNVIDLLSKYFIPVFVARDEARQVEPSKSDQDEVLRISRECRTRNLPAGSVCVYVVHPDGTVLTTQMVQQASKPENLVPLLKDIIAKEKLTPRDAQAVQTVELRQPVRPKTEGGVVLHVWTRFEGGRADYGLSEDWLELSRPEWASFVPPAELKPGASWPVPDKVAEKLFRYFFPPGPNWDIRQSAVLKAGLTATLLAVTTHGLEITLRGMVELSYPFAGPGTEGKVTAQLVGVVRHDPRKNVLDSLALVSEEAKYVWQWQGKPQPEKMAIAVELERP